MTPIVVHRAFVDRIDRPFGMLADRQQEYLPGLRYSGRTAFGTDAIAADSSANRARNEMVFERVVPSCYLLEPFSALLEQSVSASQALNEVPAEDMHRAVLKIFQVYAEIRETAKRIDASSPRELDHDKEADGMSAGG